MATLLSGVASTVANSFGAGASTYTSSSNGFANIYQTYRTQSVANNNLALYEFVIRNPQPPYTRVLSFIFPISPSNLQKKITAMTSYYDVQGSPVNNGVHRIVDEYGNSPVTFILDGTTGWKKHSNDGFAFTGLQSILNLQNFINLYARKNQEIIARGGSNLYIMEFYDFFTQDFWEVVVIKQPVFRQDVNEPILTYYHIELAGISPLAKPKISSKPPNPIDQLFSLTASNLILDAQSTANSVGSSYNTLSGVPETLGGVS